MVGLRAFITDFFRCAECRAHFLEKLNAPKAAQVKTRDDAALWLWESHNGVNTRLAQVLHSHMLNNPLHVAGLDSANGCVHICGVCQRCKSTSQPA